MIQIKQSNLLAELCAAGSLLSGLENYYSGFGDWYTNKVMPGVLMGTDVLLVARDKQRAVGVALAKKSPEVKLRCVRVLPEYQNRGVGIRLIEHALKALDTDKPHCTVAEEMLHQFSRPFINHFNFELSRVEKGMYRPGKLEYVFNALKVRDRS